MFFSEDPDADVLGYEKNCRFAGMWLTHCLWVTGCLLVVVMANGDMQHCAVLAFLAKPRFLNVFVRCICLNCKIHLSKFQNIFLQIG